jgi:hypothetical protein
MKALKVFVLGVSMLFASQSVFALPDSAVLERVAVAKAQFQDVLAKTPEKEVRVAAFFTNDVSLENVRDALRNSPNLVLKGFRHGTESYAGGYGLKSGETIDEAIVNYRRDHLFFLEKRMEMEDQMPSMATDETLKKAIIAHRKGSEQMKTDFEERGLRIIGVELSGKAKHIGNFKDETPFVRVVELQEGEKHQPAILPQQ